MLLVIATVAITAIHVQAGAWNQEAGHCQIIFTSSFLQTNTTFDASGTKRPFANQGQFRQLSLNPYAECGLTRRYSLVLSLNASFLRYGDQYGSSNSAGLGDVEVGLKRRLNAPESKWAVAAQISTLFPGYPADRNPAPGNHQEDVEGRFLVGRGAMHAHRQFFWDAEAAYRYRFGAPADQVRGDVSAGYNVTARLMGLGQVFAIKGLRNGDPFNATNPNAQSDFDLYKAQVSAVVLVRRGTRIQIGWSNAFAGRNTGGGHTVLVGVWKTF